jgi:hypothetical protein
LSSKVSANGKSETCDEANKAGVKNYKAANLVVRAMKRNNGPLSIPKKGVVRPACHQLCSNIFEVLGTGKGKGLCELIEDFSIQQCCRLLNFFSKERGCRF